MATRLIVGLGNPGERYAGTRHNAGFMAIDAVAAASGVSGWTRECESLVGSAEIAGIRVAIAKPLTFMNLSGHAVRLLLERFSLSARDLILVFDDLNLPFGRIRVRERGSAGGHRGVESVIRSVETEEFFRVRLGIFEEGMPADKAQFVLSEFSDDRKGSLGDMVARAADAVAMIVGDGIEKAMSVFNAQEKEKQL